MSKLRVCYQTFEFGDDDIHVRTLRDKQQFLDVDGAAEALGVSPASWPLFGVVWESGRVLANLMHQRDIQGIRILEVGCGIGLASLVLNARSADITASDYNPEAGNFLSINVALNAGKEIPFVRTAWEDAHVDMGEFDLIIGSDVLYEPNHADLLSSFIDLHAKPCSEVILVDPGRGHQAAFNRYMVAMGYDYTRTKPESDASSAVPFGGHIHHYGRL